METSSSFFFLSFFFFHFPLEKTEIFFVFFFGFFLVLGYEVLSKFEEIGAEGWNAQEKDYCFAYIPPEASEETVETETTASRLIVKCASLGSELCVTSLVSAGRPGDEDDDVKERPPLLVSFEVKEEAAASSGSGDPLKSIPVDYILKKLQSVSFPLGLKQETSSPTPNQNQNRTEPPPMYPPPPPAARPAMPAMPNPPLVGVGSGDLNPFHGMDRFRDPFNLGGGGAGGPLRGSQVGPNDPIFQRQGMPSLPGRPGLGVPTRGLPPGARWDPINPPGMRGFDPDDFVQPQGPDRRFQNIHPDLPQPPEGGGGHMDHMFG